MGGAEHLTRRFRPGEAFKVVVVLSCGTILCRSPRLCGQFSYVGNPGHRCDLCGWQGNNCKDWHMTVFRLVLVPTSVANWHGKCPAEGLWGVFGSKAELERAQAQFDLLTYGLFYKPSLAGSLRQA